jgi:hypothetical protein
VVFVVDVRLFGDDAEHLGLEFRGRLRTLVRRSSRVPILQKGVLLFRIGQILRPAGERFPIERRAGGCVCNFTPAIAGGEHIPRGLGRQDETQLCGLRVDVLLEFFLFFPDKVFLGFIYIDGFLGSQRNLMQLRVAEDAHQRVEIAGGNRVVLVIVTLRAGHREPEESAGRGIHAFVLHLRA